MENLSVDTATPAVATAVTHTAPTAKTPSPAPIMRTDTQQVDAVNKDIDMPKLTAHLNKVAESEHLDISFGYNEKIDRVIINVMDKNTGEIIRELPSEDAVKFAEGMEELLGKLFDRKG